MEVTKNVVLDYHILILDRLIELAEFLDFQGVKSPVWLLDSIFAMSNWLLKIRLLDGSYPRFNDCATDTCRSLDTTMAASFNFLSRYPEYQFASNLHNYSDIIDLDETGWIFFDLVSGGSGI